MCRTGGRRCPSHTDPIKIAARNARRRAAYANKEAKGTATGSSSFIPTFNEKSTWNEDLQITTREAEGELVDNLYWDKTQVTGQISYPDLDEESYMDFGFQELSPFEDNTLTSSDYITDSKKVKELSKQELSHLTKEEKEAVHLFSTDEFLRINADLYGMELDESLREPDYDYDLPTVLKSMDTIFNKTPGIQRTVYRGMGLRHMLFEQNGGESYIDPNDYMYDNYTLGSEVVFDGYQSSSTDPEVGLSFAGNQGLLFRVKTSSGLNITSISEYDSEKEVLLPKQARYMVVGVHDSIPVNTEKGEEIVNVIDLVEINDDGYVTGEAKTKH